MDINPQLRKRLLQRRAKRMLEARGFGLKKLQSGGYIVINGETEAPIAQFETIEQVGLVMGLWGTPAQTPADPGRDVLTGRDTPLKAAQWEQIQKGGK